MLAIGLASGSTANAQGFLKKLKDKATAVADKAIDKKVNNAAGLPSESAESNSSSDESGSSSSSTSSRSTASRGRAVNKGGEGLKNTTPPDVNQQMTDAETALLAKNYNEARYSVQQALLGVEIQLGKKHFKVPAATVNSLPIDTANDKVNSTSWGWNNLTIQRVYRKDDKELNVTIGNNAFYAPLLNVYFGNAYMQSNGETQNVKQIKVKGNKAIIKYEESEGYTVLVPLGQSGIITWQGINFATEQEMMTAVNSFDVEGIKNTLGEK